MHKCSVNRLKGETGFCRSSSKLSLYSYSPHHGEEPPLSGVRGSGTMFFTHCNMKCVYCQNYIFSQESNSFEIEVEEPALRSLGVGELALRSLGVGELAEKMLELEGLGCHNINLVSPTHYASQIVEALQIAKKSLHIPIVYNTGGYDNIELVKLLDGIIDIYMPDMRYSRDAMALKYSSAPNYVENNRLIVKEMFRQTGILKLNAEGVAEKGVIVRLLILPNNISGTIDTLRFLKEEVSEDIFLSIMSQYHPTYRAREFPEIARRINKKEYEEVLGEVEKLGFKNGWIQGFITEVDHFLGTNIKPNRTPR